MIGGSESRAHSLPPRRGTANANDPPSGGSWGSRAGLKRSGVQTQCLRLAACLNPFQGQAVGNHRGGLVTGTGAGEDFPQRVADAAYMAVDLRGAATAALVVDIDDAARIDGVIGCPELVALAQHLADLRGGQLVVGSARDNRRTQHFQGLLIENAAHGAGCEYVHVEPVDI